MLKKFGSLLFAECHMTFLSLKRYPMVPATLAITLYVIFLGIFLGFKYFAVDFGGDGATSLLLGYLLWTYAMFAINDSAEAISNDIHTGILEQIYTSPFPPLTITIVRSIASFLNATIINAVIMVLALITVKVSLDTLVLGYSILVLLPMLIGLYGFGLILGGFTLIFVRTGQLGQILNFVLLFLGGVVIPISSMPSAIRPILALIPLSSATNYIREIVASSYFTILSWEYLKYLLLNGVLALIGVCCFKYMNHIVRSKGNLGKY